MQSLTLGVPSLIDAKSLIVKGPVKFVPGVKIIGDVTFTNGVPVDAAVPSSTYVSTVHPCRLSSAQPRC